MMIKNDREEWELPQSARANEFQRESTLHAQGARHATCATAWFLAAEIRVIVEINAGSGVPTCRVSRGIETR